MPAESNAIPFGPLPVVPRIVESQPAGVIFDTLFEP